MKPQSLDHPNWWDKKYDSIAKCVSWKLMNDTWYQGVEFCYRGLQMYFLTTLPSTGDKSKLHSILEQGQFCIYDTQINLSFVS